MPQNSSPISIRIRSSSGDLYVMGPGKADLLIAIQETGSIAAAGRKVGMSYQKTRQLVDEMNQCFVSPLVEGFKGGAQSGGALLTDVGREVLAHYQMIQARAEPAIAADLEALQKLLRR
jgi:molybdate transport system regulatory protein